MNEIDIWMPRTGDSIRGYITEFKVVDNNHEIFCIDRRWLWRQPLMQQINQSHIGYGAVIKLLYGRHTPAPNSTAVYDVYLVAPDDPDCK